MFGLKTRRRARLRAQPFPDLWRSILQRNVPYYGHLSPGEQQELQQHIQVFVAEKNFEGCGGLELTDEIKVTVAAYACILLLHLRHDYYPRLQSILVYPDAYPVPEVRSYAGNIVVEAHELRAGESWRTGVVVISWNHVLHRPADPSGNRNVALHEFAHQLDEENGSADGAPILPRSSRYGAWARILGREYRALADAAAADRPTLLDKYGATNPAEFFAVVTEYFFEQPQQLKQRHPELYEELKLFYQQDPGGCQGSQTVAEKENS
ncbi:MAG TPA: M90 family metallopeptidase [Verrucomicrobiae bacterium]|nr:M90 family metallopeptidase [Verrucomicrobiae bacterium]